MYITWSKPLVCLILILVFNMSKFVTRSIQAFIRHCNHYHWNKSDSSCRRVPSNRKVKFICGELLLAYRQAHGSDN